MGKASWEPPRSSRRGELCLLWIPSVTPPQGPDSPLARSKAFRKAVRLTVLHPDARQNKDFSVTPQHVPELDLLVHVEEKSAGTGYLPCLVVTFSFTEPFLQSLGEGSFVRERT